jgi:RNAse (barnase) inhibitor barstar
MLDLSLLNTSAYPPGIYRLASRARPTSILEMITDWGWYAGYINGRDVEDKQAFLLAAGQAYAFPAYYGRNWDAFEEMVNDLSWINAKGTLLLYDYVHRFAAAQPEEWQTALSILESAAQHWHQEGYPFYVLLRHNWRWNRHLPKLAA